MLGESFGYHTLDATDSDKVLTMRIKQTFFKLIMPIVKLYWYIFKPESYGARVLIIHPTEKSKMLLVRHSYGNTALWNIPGGGYNPKMKLPLLQLLEKFWKN